jgi:hypothetical protein
VGGRFQVRSARTSVPKRGPLVRVPTRTSDAGSHRAC